MWDIIRYIFRLLFEGAVGGLGFWLSSFFFIKIFINPKSNLHYEKLIQKIQTWYFGLQVMVLFTLINLLRGTGLLKFSSKESEEKFEMMLLVFAILAFVITHLDFNDKKKKIELQ